VAIRFAKAIFTSMNFQPNPNDAEAVHPETGTTGFRLMTVYDSETAGAEAGKAFEIVRRELEGGVPITKSLWPLEALASESARAAAEAAVADMILVSLDRPPDLAKLKNWTGAWEKQRIQPGGLIALLNDSRNAEIRELLEGAALTASMDFLCQDGSRWG
jgi:hypothetical protein